MGAGVLLGRRVCGQGNAAERATKNGKPALEMAVNEETERRALEGELDLLEREWREAEELAAIADDLLLPLAVRDRIHRWKEEASP